MPFDVVTFGEAMIRLSPPNFLRLEQARTLDLRVGGAELNTAAGLARLGHPSAWVSRLTNNPLGRLIANHAREIGVSTEHVVCTNDDRVGLYFLEFGAAPRASSVLYDRKNAAIASLTPGVVSWAKIFAGAKWFHVTGITPGLSASAAAVTKEALVAAKAAGLQTSVDLNYRVKLLTPRRRAMHERIDGPHRRADHDEEDIERVFGIKARTTKSRS